VKYPTDMYLTACGLLNTYAKGLATNCYKK